MTKTIIQRSISLENNKLKDLIHPVLEKIYIARGISDSEQLERGLNKLHAWELLSDIRKIIKYLAQAIINKEKILVIGDFDADGATSTAVAVTGLRLFGAEHVSFLVPNRFEYGYGLTPEIVEVAANSQPDWIITVDNGISSIAGVARAKELGIKVLITDHHLAGAELPAAEAMINPNQSGDQFPSKNLAGVGVIFYVMMALRSYLREQQWFATQNRVEPNIGQLLDLVALGTVADVVPLDQNNRILVHQGLARIRAGKCRPGIQALLEVSGRNAKNLTASDLGFALGPRLNAAGRLDDMSLGIECLLTDDLTKARQIATQLDDLNKQRQEIEADMQQQAAVVLKQLHLTDSLAIGLCLFDPTWHQGVVGLLASRIKDKLYRPVIAFAEVNANELKGSARSVKGVHIRDVLDNIAVKHPGLISKFGGHAMAAGVQVSKANYEQFATAFNQEVSRYLSLENIRGVIESDGELAEEYLTLALAELIQGAGPWGQDFPEPIFNGNFTVIDQRLVGQKHLKLILQAGEKMLDAIAFNINPDNWPNHRCQKIHAAYRLDINEFRERRSLQLIIEYFEIAGSHAGGQA